MLTKIRKVFLAYLFCIIETTIATSYQVNVFINRTICEKIYDIIVQNEVAEVTARRRCNKIVYVRIVEEKLEVEVGGDNIAAPH